MKAWKSRRYLDVQIRKRPWKEWYAWRPVKDIHGKWHWLNIVYRKLGNDYVDHDDFSWYFYGTLFDVLENE
jgi:hypothetical protein